MSVNIQRNLITPIVVGCAGTGTSASAVFQKLYEVTGSPGQLVAAILNVSGDFSELQFNLEYTADQSFPNWEVVKTWNPLTDGVGYFPISEAGAYRLNCVEFEGGTSVDVDGTVGLPAGIAASGGSGPSSDVTLVGSTITLPVSIAGQPIDVNVVSGGGSNDSVGPTGTTAPTSATEVGFIDGSGNLVAPSPGTPMPVTVISGGGSPNVNLIEVGGEAIALGQTTMSASLPVTLAADQSAIAVTGTFWPYTLGQQDDADSVPVVLPADQIAALTPPTADAIAAAIAANPPTVTVGGTVAVSNDTLSEMSFTPYGSPAVEALNVYVVNEAGGSSCVTQCTSPWVVEDTAAEESLAALASTVITAGSPPQPAIAVEVLNQTTTAIAPISSEGLAPDLIAVAETSTLVLASNASRKGCNLTNMSNATISLAFGSNPAQVYFGVVLGPGGSFWMDLQDFTVDAINAIADSANGYLAAQEFD